MISKAIQKAVKIASEVENTKELKSYWQKRYSELFLDKKLFYLSKKTLSILQQDMVESPATPFGEIVLKNHLDANNKLDELKIQNTVEASLRFLDSLIDQINFSEQTKNIVKQYRKIGFGLADFQEYINSQSEPNIDKEIDYIGHLISTACYRVSESLAEEKGACASWNLINKHLRPKAFEYWENQTTGKILNGLEMFSQFDNQEEVEKSSFRIIPRRNSNILLFPTEKPWQDWSDRDQTAPQTPLDQNEIADKITNESKKTTKNPEFQPGELVKINKVGDSEHNKIYQVVETISTQDTFKYKLQNEKNEISKMSWAETNLTSVELSQVLEKINSNPTEKTTESKNLNIYARAIIIHNNQILIEKKEEELNLPGAKIYDAKLIEKNLCHFLKEKYEIDGKIIDEIGSSLNQDDNILNIGFTLNTKKLPYNRNFYWVDLDNNDLPEYIKILIEKQKRRYSIVENLKRDLQREINQIKNNPIQNTKKTISLSKVQNNQKKLTKNHMAKYILKLERLIKTNTFDNVLVTIQYDSTGPKAVLVDSDSIQGELQQTLEAFLNLINFILSSSIAPEKLANRIEKFSMQGPKLPINNLLIVIAAALKEAPDNADEINSSLLKIASEEIPEDFTPEVAPEFIPTNPVSEPAPIKQITPKLKPVDINTDDEAEDQKEVQNAEEKYPEEQEIPIEETEEIAYNPDAEPDKKTGFSFNPFSKKKE